MFSSEQPTPKSKNSIVRWVVGGFFVIFALVNGFHFSSLFLLLAAFLMFPLTFITSFLESKNIKPIVAIVLSVILFCAGAMMAPLSATDIPSTNPNQSQVPGDDVPGDDVPGDDFPGDDVPGDDVPGDDVPGDDVPGDDVPGDDVPGDDVPGSTVPTKKSYIIQFSATLKENNSLGDQWSTGAIFNNKNITSGSTVEAEDENGLSITVFANEDDASKDDYGSQTIVFSDIAVGSTETKTITVTVIENDGRYKGNTAIWEFTVSIQRTA